MINNLKDYLYYNSYNYSYWPRIYMAVIAMTFAVFMPVGYYANHGFDGLPSMALSVVCAGSLFFWQLNEYKIGYQLKNNKDYFIKNIKNEDLIIDWDSYAKKYSDHLSRADMDSLHTEKQIYDRMVEELARDPREFISKFSELKTMNKILGENDGTV